MVDAIGTCSRCESPIERGDLRCAICSLAVPVEHASREETEVRIMRCGGCGAAVDYDVEVQAPRCAFCDSVMKIERLVDPLEEAELHLPFQVDRDTAQRAVTSWLGSLGWFRPGDLKQKARIEGVRPLQWVGWVFDADALVSWTADSDLGSWRADWAPYSGQVELRFDDICVSATRGLTDVEVDAMVPHYDLGTAVPQEMLTATMRPEGTSTERFDVQRSAARARVASAIERTALATVAERHVPGTRRRKVRVLPLVRALTTRRFSFPAWVMAYRYKGELYRAVVCGQDARCVLGKAPYSWLRIAAVGLGGAFLLLLVLVLLLAAR